MDANSCSSSLGLGLGFHCDLCNVSFKKHKFLKIHCVGLFHRDRLILMSTASCADESSSLIEKNKDECSSLNKLVTLQHSSDCSKQGIPNLSASVPTGSENDKTSISQEVSGNWRNSLCIPEITAGFSNFVQSTPESHRLTSDSLVDKNQKLDDRTLLNLNTVSLSHDNTFLPKIKNAVEVKESFSCKLCRIQTSDRNSLSIHTSSLEHCKLFVLRQNELGMEEFKKQFGNVPFTRILSENIPAPPDDFDPNMTRIYQSAVVTNLLCRLCDRQCKTLEEWFQHVYDPSHCQKLNWLHGHHGVFLFLVLYGDLPLPESLLPKSVSDGMARAADVLERSEIKSARKELKLPENLTVFDYNFTNISIKSDYENSDIEKISLAADEDLCVDHCSGSAPKSNRMQCSFKIIDHNFESEKKETELSATTEEAACSKPFANTLPAASTLKSSCDSHHVDAGVSMTEDEVPCELKHSDRAEVGFSCLSKSNCSEIRSVDSELLVVDKVLEKISLKNDESLLTDFQKEAAELYESNLTSESDIRVCDASSLPFHIGSYAMKESKLTTTTTETTTNSVKSSSDNLAMVSENEVDGLQETEGQAIPVLSSSVHQNFSRSSKSSNRAYKCLREISSQPDFCNESGQAGGSVIVSSKSKYNKIQNNVLVTNIVAVRSQPPCPLANTSPTILGVSSSCDTLIPSSGCLTNSDPFTAYPLVGASRLESRQSVSSSSYECSQSACTYSETPSSSIASDLHKVDGSIHGQEAVCLSINFSSVDLRSQYAVTASSAFSSLSLCFCVSHSLSSVASSSGLASCNCRAASFESSQVRESQLVGPPIYVFSKLTNEINSESKSKSEPIKVDENTPTSVKCSSDNAFVSSAILEPSVQTSNYKVISSEFSNKVVDVISSSTAATLLALQTASSEMKSISENSGVDVDVDLDRTSSNIEKLSSHNDFSISCFDSRCPDPSFSGNANPILHSLVEQSSETTTANSSRVVSNTVKCEDFDSIQNPLIKVSADQLVSAALTKPLNTNISALAADMSLGDSLPNIKPVESHEPPIYLGFAILEESTSLRPSTLQGLVCPLVEVENEDTSELYSSAPIFSCPLPVISSSSTSKTSVINEKVTSESKLNAHGKKRHCWRYLRRTSKAIKPLMSTAPVFQSSCCAGTVPCVINSTPVFSCALPLKSSNSAAATATVTSVINEKVILKSKLNAPGKKRHCWRYIRRTSKAIKPLMSIAPVFQFSWRTRKAGVVPLTANGLGSCLSTAVADMPAVSSAVIATAPLNVCKVVCSFKGVTSLSSINKQAVDVTEQQNLSKLLGESSSSGEPSIKTGIMNKGNCDDAVLKNGKTVSTLNKEQITSKTLKDTCSPASMNSNALSSFTQIGKPGNLLDRSIANVATSNTGEIRSFTREENTKCAASVSVSEDNRTASSLIVTENKDSATNCISESSKIVSPFLQQQGTGKTLKDNITNTFASKIGEIISSLVQTDCTENTKMKKGSWTGTCVAEVGNSLSKVTNSEKILSDCVTIMVDKIQKRDSTFISKTSSSAEAEDTEKMRDRDSTSTAALKPKKTVPPSMQEHGTKSMDRIMKGGNISACVSKTSSVKAEDTEKMRGTSTAALKPKKTVPPSMQEDGTKIMDKLMKGGNTSACVSKTSCSIKAEDTEKMQDKDGTSTAALKPKKTVPPSMQEHGTKIMDKMMKGGNTSACISKTSSSVKAEDTEKMRDTSTAALKPKKTVPPSMQEDGACISETSSIKAGDTEKMRSKSSTGYISASQKWGYSEKTRFYKKSSSFLSAGSGDHQARTLFYNQFLHKKPNFSSSTSRFSKPFSNCGGSENFAQQQASRLEYLNDVLTHTEQNVGYKQNFDGRMGFQNDSRFGYDERRGQTLLSPESYFDGQKSFGRKRQFQSFARGVSPVSKIPYLVHENANYTAQLLDRDYRHQTHHFTENRNSIKFMETLKNIAYDLQLPGAQRKCYAMETNLLLDSMSFRDRQRVSLLSRFIAIENNFALLQAANDLATLDMTLLNQYSELRERCIDLGLGLGEIMISLLDALWDGHKLHLF